MNREMFLFLEHLQQHMGLQYSHLLDLCKSNWEYNWQFRVLSRNAWRAFSHSREIASQKEFKGGASEMLTICPLVQFFVESTELRRRPELTAQVDSFVACCRVSDLLLEGKRGRGRPAECREAIVRHHGLFLTAYGSDPIVPKHHYTFHLPDQDSIDCFTCERKHIGVKELAEHVRNTTNYEASVLGKVLLQQEQRLQSEDFADGLQGPRSPCPELVPFAPHAQALVAEEVKVRGAIYHVGDVIFYGDASAGRVEACASLDGVPTLVVQPLVAVRRRTSAATEWRMQPDCIWALVPLTAASKVRACKAFFRNGALLTALA